MNKWCLWKGVLFSEIYKDNDKLQYDSKKQFIKIWTINVKKIKHQEMTNFFGEELSFLLPNL